MPMQLLALPKAFGLKDSVAKGEIGIIPLGGYRGVNAQSRKALQWLLLKERELGRAIIHAARGREQRLLEGPLVNGYYETENLRQRHVLQFHGCFWHGCPKCFRVNRNRPLSTVSCEDTIEARYERTLAMTCRFKKRGRELFRCHPDIYVGEERCALIGAGPDFNFDAVEGLIRCRVLAPRDLFHPILPYRVNGKLLFALCRSCCKTFSQTACTHDDPVDREFEGAWVSCELRKAIEKSYRVTSVSEIWSYKITRYDPVTRWGGLFAEYINCFLQLKQEASGWPNECANDEGGKERYLREYEKIEGIVLNRSNISPNPGLRSVAKLCLNSFWGKFGQQSSTEIVRTWESFTALLTSSEHEITDVLPVNDEVIYVSWRSRHTFSADQRRDSRLHHGVSPIKAITNDPDEYKPRTGNFLGDMTDELESHGPSSYQYIETSIKSLLLADEKLKRGEETGEDKTVIKLRFSAIRRTVFHDIVTRDETKSCIPVLLKRIFNDNGYSAPYGYVSSE
ncbi:uncharacterized protein LOC116851356 [Odontomachus brunneus]|uniref:uncharacterized protein LOC116851356 n=1 Tax=Odontomachus brunneus TaxID=486640 RepID=UPI0013F22808|nr:uncharacterized protein LOC116851356 [Odontomachus brunneus]